VGLQARRTKSPFIPLQPRTLPTEFTFQGQKEGFFTFGLRVDGPQRVVLRIVLVDGVGLRSRPVEIEIEAAG